MIDSMPACSKTNPLLAKAKPISDGGSASVITYLRREKTQETKQQHSQPQRGVRRCERNNFADTKVSEEGGGGGGPGAGAEIPLQPLVKTMVKQAVPLQPMEVNGGADIHLQPVQDPTPEQIDVPKEAVAPWEARAGAGSWQDLWTHGERSPCRSRFAGRTCDPVGDPMLEQSAPEGLHLMGETHTGAVHEEVCGGLSPVRGTPCWSKEKV
ncbi:hypothetical protein GRJ2_003163100 [Grus japonensis]|uniref:Protein pxr1-like n=1 Tax=Grus japonensis TaxID=30415 RepID=A0ABC9YA90_GRUJA